MEPVAGLHITSYFETPSTHIKTGPSHDTLGLINPEDFSKDGLVRTPDAREHAKRIIGAGGLRLDFCPLPVLLFGVTTLRVT